MIWKRHRGIPFALIGMSSVAASFTVKLWMLKLQLNCFNRSGTNQAQFEATSSPSDNGMPLQQVDILSQLK